LAGFLTQRENVVMAEVEDRQVRVLYRGEREDQGNLLKDIIGGGYTVTQFYEVRRNLEEAFMAVTGEVDGR